METNYAQIPRTHSAGNSMLQYDILYTIHMINTRTEIKSPTAELVQSVLILILVYGISKGLFCQCVRTTTGIHLPLVSGTPSNHPTISRDGQPAPESSKAHKRQRLPSQNDDNNENSNPKRRRTSKYHPDQPSCLPCVLWRQSGSDMQLEQFHPISGSRHAGREALSLTQYASFDNVSFNLESNDCVCHPCYADYQRNKQNKENTVPRWAKIKHEYYAQARVTKHCIFCCGSHCQCDDIHQWGPDKWYGEDSISEWKQYLSLTGKVDYAIGDHISHICRSHYRRVFELKATRKCTTCTSPDAQKWTLVCNIANNPEKICEAFSLELGSVQFFDWICNQCSLCYCNGEQLETQLNSSCQSQDPLTAKRSTLLMRTLATLKEEGIVFTKEVRADFRTILCSLNIDQNCHLRLCNTFSKYLSNLTSKHHFKVYAPSNGNVSLGKAIYDERKFSFHSAAYAFKIKQEEWEKEKTHIGLKQFQQLVKKQTFLFPNSKNYNYIQTIKKDTMELGTFFDPQLIQIIDTITTSTNASKKTCSPLYADLRSSRIKMIIALLCFTMNPSCCFIQTIIGLMCYAYGLRDKGFELLNAMGCASSIDHIRAHGSYWASRHIPTLQLNAKQFWRITIDNLNFYLKFAKNLPESAAGAKKMLNLLTGQVTHQVSNTTESHVGPLTLVDLAHNFIKKSVHSTISSKIRDSVQIQDFSNQIGTNENYYFEQFIRVCYTCVINRLPLLPTDHNKTFTESLQGYMPHWTPPVKDNIVYATIDEALSGSMADIEAYLMKLKRDLHIGEEGYPKVVTLAGDQQTYALMKDIQRKYPDHYSWFVVLHGDWHMLQLTAEILRDILWDGGLKQLSHDCGHKKLPTQWQEVHMLLLALHETLFRKAIVACRNTTSSEPDLDNYNNFAKWMEEVTFESNNDQSSRFWASMMSFLTAYVGYYFSVRSGNWLLRNSCLRALLPLIFAYNHNKYEELCCMAIMDTLTLPNALIHKFLDGEWTVSVKGRPYHNLALDEAHESVINLRLKTITARPSHFRTVELSNFMSYLDKVVRGFESLVYRYKQTEPAHQSKRFICQRTTRMINFMKDVPLFSVSDTTKVLCNILCSQHKVDSSTVQDLLNISNIGIERMNLFVEEYILPQPTNGPKKRRKRLRKLATFTHKSSSTKEGKRREQELSNIAKNAMTILQAHGITAQTSPYPLAIADIHGNMRSSQKSDFFTALSRCIQFDKVIFNSCPLLSNPPQDLSAIIDLLYFLHMPPPPSIITFHDYFNLLWQQTVGKYVYRHQALYIYIIIDKPDFLPPPRSIVHKSRAHTHKSNQTSNAEPAVTDESQIPHGKTYSSFLSNSPSFKVKLVEYVTSKYLSQGISSTKLRNFSVILDSPSLPSLTTIRDGRVYHSESNEHGEADYAVWHHCLHSPSNNIIIVSSDTDTWVYGLGICETREFGDKQVYVQRGNNESFININEATALIISHPVLSTISYPALSLVALYVLTGCDYVSSFYRCTKTNFLETLINNIAFVCPDGHFLRMEMGEFQHIKEHAWIRLVTAVYFFKHKSFFRSKTISHVYSLICDHPDSEEAQRMLSAINFSTTLHTSLFKWHEFIRKVGYHTPRVTKLHEFKLIPSLRALFLHCMRANYIIKLSLSVPLFRSPFLPCFEQFGWNTTDGQVCITWNDGDSPESEGEESEEESDHEAEDEGQSESEDEHTDRLQDQQIVGEEEEDGDTPL